MNRYLLISLLFCLPIWLSAQDTDIDDVTLQRDSVWYDAVTGRRMHLQRLGGVDTLVYVKPNALSALAKDIGINVAILSYDHFVQNRWYAHISRHDIEHHFTHAPVWDNDSFSGNQFSHPYHGGMFYNTARNDGLSYGVSLLYPVIGSFTWEYFCETNAPAINDLLSTGIGGAAIGEVTHRVSDIFFDDSRVGANRVVREIVGTLLNPVRGAHRLLSGEMWRVSQSRGKREQPQPYSFDIGVGYRNMAEDKGNKEVIEVPYIDFSFLYGNRFTASGHSRPYDFFSVQLLANLQSGQPSVGQLEIMGRIADKQYASKNDWRFDVGFYQHLKYVDHYSKHVQDPHNFSIISEAVSFGTGLYAEKEWKHSRLSDDLMLNAVVLGGTPADFFPRRRYDFGTGFSVRNHTHFALNGKLTVGNQFYFMRLYTLKGNSPAEEQRRRELELSLNSWGDQGNHYIMTNRTYAQLSMFTNTRLNVEYELYRRHSSYKYYPEVHAGSHEWKIGLIYSL